ncbi:MAG: hypothetical protein NVS2B8_06550 [Vulcanimicrobiaceae bacterium]
MSRLALSLLAAASIVIPTGASGRPLAAPDPCKLVGNDDAFRLLGWTIDQREKRPYAILGATGKICFLHASQGQIIVTVPDRGIGFVGATPYNDSNAKSLARPVFGLGADVVLYNGTVYVTRYKRSISVHVVPNDAPASYADVEGFAQVAIRHMQ